MLQMLKLSVSQVKRSGTDTSARRKSAIFDGFCEPRNGHGLTTGISTSLLTSKPGVTYAIAANMQITTRQSQIANFAPGMKPIIINIIIIIKSIYKVQDCLRATNVHIDDMYMLYLYRWAKFGENWLSGFSLYAISTLE